jgi:hypothetical protein
MIGLFKSNKKLGTFKQLVKNAGGVAYWDARKAINNGLPTNSPLTPAWEDLIGNSYNVTLTNILGTDGNFGSDSNSDGVADGWSKNNVVNDCSISNNVQSFTPDAQYNGLVHTVTPITGNKYYAFAYVKTSSTATVPLLLQSGGLPQSQSNIHTRSGNWEFLSTPIATATSTTNGQCRVHDSSASAKVPIQMKQVHVLNLTAIFGEGFEPSKAWLDYYIQLYYSNTYFSTTSFNYDNRAINVNMAGTTSSGVDITDTSKPLWKLDGTDDHLQIINNSKLDVSDRVGVFATIKTPATFQVAYIFAKNLDATANIQYGMYIHTPTNILTAALNGSAIAGNTALQTNTWYNVGFIWTGTQITIYLNLVADKVQNYSTPLTSRPNLRIGCRGNTSSGNAIYFNGSIATVTVYTGAKCTESNILRAEKAISKAYIN